MNKNDMKQLINDELGKIAEVTNKCNILKNIISEVKSQEIERIQDNTKNQMEIETIRSKEKKEKLDNLNQMLSTCTNQEDILNALKDFQND